jgi:hypothetical protein
MPTTPTKRPESFKSFLTLVRSRCSPPAAKAAYDACVVDANKMRAADYHAVGSVGTLKDPLPIEHQEMLNLAVVAAAGSRAHACQKTKMFVCLGGSKDSRSNNAHKCAISAAITARNVDVFDYLLELEAFLGNHFCRGGNPLHQSLKTMPKLARGKRSDDEASLHMMTTLYVAGVNSTARDENGRTAIQCAAHGGHVAALDFLAKASPGQLNIRDTDTQKRLIHHVGNACPDTNCFFENCDPKMLDMLTLKYTQDCLSTYRGSHGERVGLSLCPRGRKTLFRSVKHLVGVGDFDDFLVDGKPAVMPKGHRTRIDKRADKMEVTKRAREERQEAQRVFASVKRVRKAPFGGELTDASESSDSEEEEAEAEANAQAKARGLAHVKAKAKAKAQAREQAEAEADLEDSDSE